MVKASEVMSNAMMKHVASVHQNKAVAAHQAAKREAARSRREVWEDAARRRFPGRPDWEAFEMQREWDEEHQ